MHHTDTVIVLRTRPLREADLLVTVLSKEHGRFTGVASHAKRSRKRFGGALEPGIIGQLRWTERREQELVRCEELAISQDLPRRIRELPYFAALGVMLNIVEAMVPEREVTPDKFELVQQSLQAFDHYSPKHVMRYFLAQWLRCTGFAPILSHAMHGEEAVPDNATAYFVPQAGGIVRYSNIVDLSSAVAISPAARALWIADCASRSPEDICEDNNASETLYRQGMWSYVQHVIERPLSSAGYWDMIWGT